MGASSYAKPMASDARSGAPKPLEIDAIEVSDGRQWASASVGHGGRNPRPLASFHCRKLGHCTAVCRAPAPVLVNVLVDEIDSDCPATQ